MLRGLGCNVPTLCVYLTYVILTALDMQSDLTRAQAGSQTGTGL